ncbi:MAG TPA: flavin reductase family protein [Lacipirellulaceae bacterium]|nr:flavin reductase family protein [Lacipirellulaceae bacterium]
MNAPHDPLMAALGRVTSGVYILTAGAGDRATGMLASWVMQAGFEPPMVTVAIRQGRYVGDWLTAGEPFALNIVGEDQKHLLRHFGKGFEPGEPAFTGLEVRATSAGIPALVGAVGHLLCEPVAHFDSGDHRIFLARVAGGELAQEGPPMVHMRKSGAHY